MPLALVWIIRDHQYIGGTVLLLTGRLCDLIDGWLADKTGTKSPLGEKVDATFDKLSTGLAVIVLTSAAVVPWWGVVPFIAPHLIIAVVAIKAYTDNRTLHPSRPGKLSMAFGWVGLLLFVVDAAPSAGFMWVAALACSLAGALLGLLALTGYVKNYQLSTAPIRSADP